MILTKFAEIILATMIQIIPPGQSVYSQVPITTCDETCQETPMCNNAQDWRCKSPRFSQGLYEKYLDEFTSSGMNPDAAADEARLRSFTRPETAEEGFARYAIIAQALANVSKKSTRHMCKSACLEENQDLAQCSNACLSSAPWTATRKELIYMALAVISQESGFRADVHGGTGSAGRGDCKWKKNGKPVAAWTKGASRVAGTCRSVGLGQSNVGNGSIMGWTANDLVGVDLASTERNLTVAARNLALSRGLCSRSGKDIVKATFSAYGSGSACVIRQKKLIKVGDKKLMHYAYLVKENGVNKTVWALTPPDNAVSKEPLESNWPAKRSKIFWAYYARPISLTEDQRKLLNSKEVQSIITTLSTSKQIFWLPAKPRQMPKKDNNAKKLDFGGHERIMKSAIVSYKNTDCINV